MNVLSTMPTEAETPSALTRSVMIDLMVKRLQRYHGFAALERSKGFLKPIADLSTSHGQEMVRILIQRTIEEVGESYESHDLAHRKEEVIDAINFLCAALLLDPTIYTPGSLVDEVWLPLLLQKDITGWFGDGIDTHDLGFVAYALTTRLGDVFRNRAWTYNAQDHYFAGQDTFRQVSIEVLGLILKVFSSPREFWQYFIAKDRILQFRLQTQY